MKKILFVVLLALFSCTFAFAKIQFVYVKGGLFEMGTSMSTDDEGPVHEVTLSSFFISKTEITQSQWEKVMGYNNSYFLGEDRPVENVSWYEAIEFCNIKSENEGLEPAYYINSKMTKMNLEANGYRLPTEAEWEYVAGGGAQATPTVFAGSNIRNNVSNTKANATYPVATKQPNELGLFDMTGNVAEWTWDWYDLSTYELRVLSQRNKNPTGMPFGDYKVIRGGSWESTKQVSFISFRSYQYPNKRVNNVGFRIVRRK